MQSAAACPNFEAGKTVADLLPDRVSMSAVLVFRVCTQMAKRSAESTQELCAASISGFTSGVGKKTPHRSSSIITTRSPRVSFETGGGPSVVLGDSQ